MYELQICKLANGDLLSLFCLKMNEIIQEVLLYFFLFFFCTTLFSAFA